MPVVEKLGAALAAKLKPLGAVTVVSPAMGGLVIGQEVARQLGLRFIFVEKEDGKLVLRRGFKIAAGEKILVVEDVVTKGGRVQETWTSSARTAAMSSAWRWWWIAPTAR